MQGLFVLLGIYITFCHTLEVKTYIFKRGKWYHFRRRIPKDYQIFHSKDSIQIPLKTDSRSIAEQRASNFNQLLESYWDDMALNGENEMVRRTHLSGFRYRSIEDIISFATPSELINRISVANNASDERDLHLTFSLYSNLR